MYKYIYMTIILFIYIFVLYNFIISNKILLFIAHIYVLCVYIQIDREREWLNPKINVLSFRQK